MKRICIAIGLVAGLALTANAQNKFREARSVLDKLVETRELISKERTDWAVDKESMQQQIDLLQKEKQLLDEQIAKAEATSTQADKERQRLIEENEALAKASDEIKPTIALLEKRVLELAKVFPPPLTERVEPLFKRIPANPANTRLSLGERMQNVVGILSEVDKFNGVITVVSELKTNPAGADIQVRTIYLGLGAAYYTDKSGNFAGVGTPTLEGWEWTPRPELAEKIARVIYVYENASAATFVNLPVTIK